MAKQLPKLKWADKSRLKYIGDWAMETDGGIENSRARIVWMDVDGPREADLPMWVIGRIYDRIHESGIFLGIGQLLTGCVCNPALPGTDTACSAHNTLKSSP